MNNLKITITYKNIKHMYMRIIDDNTLFVTCPKGMKEEDIKKNILKNEKWLSKALVNYRQNRMSLNTITYLGKTYQLIIKEGHDNLSIKSDTITIYAKEGDKDRALRIFYERSKTVLNKEVLLKEEKYLKILRDYGYELRPSYKFRKMKSKWGVCYAKENRITLNTLLIHYPLECLESVLWHELLHFIIPDHSKRFYQVLNFHMPEYQKYHGLLK